MLEIAANNANECKHVDGTTQHLSSVNDHRVLLSSVDPTTNPPESSIDLTISSKCGNDKQASHFIELLASSFPNTQLDDRQVNSTKELQPDCLGVKDIACGDNDMPTLSSDGTYLAVDKFDELGKFDQTHQLERMSPKDNVPAIVDPKGLKNRCKVMKRRKRVPWGSEYNRRQKNPRRLPRSEMPHDELLKLREKERKAQQLRRERMKRAEEMRLKMRKEKKMNTSDAARDSLTTGDGGEGEGDGILDFHQSSTHLPLDRSVYFDGKPLYNCVLKENFMHALGLQQCDNTTAKMKPSMAEFLVNNIVSTDAESNCFNSVNDEEPRNLQHASGKSLCDVASEKSQQSMSEETSDSSEKKANSDGVSRKTRRSRLPKEDLERLREKERLAKRRQRAKNKKCDVNEDARDLPISATSQEEENDSTDTESNADSKINNDNGESSSCADNTEETKRVDGNIEEKKEGSMKHCDGKRKAFPRYYDRSMLSAEELESLRRREREYQRRRRARLREAKFKAIGALCQEENSLKGSQLVGNEESNIVDDSAKKYETRMSKGISCPSVRFLEHSSVFYCDNELTDRKTNLKDEPQSNWKPNEESSAIDYKPTISVINKVECEHDLEDRKKPGLSKLELGTIRPYLDGSFDNDQPKPMLNSMDRHWGSSPNSFNKSRLSPLSDASHRKSKIDGIESKKQDLSRFVGSENDFDDLNSRRGCSIRNETQAVALSMNSTTSMVDALYASDRKILEANGYRRMKPDQSYRYCDSQNSAHRAYNAPWDPKLRCSPQPTKYIDGQDGSLYDSRSFDYEYIADRPREMNPEGSLTIKTDINKGGDTSGNNKWRHWKSGLTDSQLQRRRQSNREAQRRRRMRLRLMQMKSSQEQDHIPFEEIMYKRFAPSRRAAADDAIREVTVSKSKLKSMLEKRQKVFIDAQIEKSRNELETKSQAPVVEEQPKKGRGCRIKVTPKRQVIVPGMGIPSNADITEKSEPSNSDVCFSNFQINGNHFASRLDELTSRYADYSGFGEQNSHEVEEQAEQTSSRKRKQFCPRRLLSEKERNNVPSLVTAL